MFDEIEELKAEINDLKSEIAEMKIAMQNRPLDSYGFTQAGNFTGNMFRNFGQTAGKIIFGNENGMMKSLMSSFNSFTNHYAKLNPRNQFSFIGQRFAGGHTSPAGSYLVGERGPEVFTPHQVGKISNHGAEKRNIYIKLNITSPDVKNFYKSKNQITDEILKNIL